MTDLKDVLEYVPEDEMSEEIRKTLISGALAGVSAEDLSGMNAIQLANFLKEKGLYAEDAKTRMSVAQKLLKIFNNYQIKPLAAAGVGKFPDKIEVITPKSVEQMSASELFEHLKKNVQDTEALDMLRQKEPVKTAALKTKEWVVTKEGVIDVAATLDYCRFLAKTGTAPMRRYNDGKTVSIEQALGIKEKPLIHPFFANEVIQNNLDRWENNWSNVDRNLMKAILWARLIRHKMWPRDVDPVDAFEEITKTPLDRRWRIIKEDYDYAVADENPEATGISLVYQEKSGREKTGTEIRSEDRPEERSSERPGRESADMINMSGVGRRGENTAYGGMSAEQYVKSHAKGTLEKSGMKNDVTGVFDYIEVNGMKNHFNAVVIRGAEINGMGNEGVIYTPPGISIEMSGMGSSLVHLQRSWEEIAEMIQKHKI